MMTPNNWLKDPKLCLQDAKPAKNAIFEWFDLQVKLNPDYTTEYALEEIKKVTKNFIIEESKEFPSLYRHIDLDELFNER